MKNFVGHNAFSRGVNAAALQPSSGWNGCDVCSLLSFILIFIADAGGIGLILAFMDLGSKNPQRLGDRHPHDQRDRHPHRDHRDCDSDPKLSSHGQ
jgi:hypothetical protein